MKQNIFARGAGQTFGDLPVGLFAIAFLSDGGVSKSNLIETQVKWGRQ